MTRNRYEEHGKAGLSGPISPVGLMQYGMHSVVEAQPWLTLAIGRDIRSWGVCIRASQGGGVWPVRSPQGIVLDSRWGRDLLDLPHVVLTAQSALRKAALDNGWPIP